MKKRWYIIIAVVMMCICAVYNIAVDNRYVMEKDLCGYTGDTNQLQINIDQDKEIIQVADKQFENGKLFIGLESVSPGKVWVVVRNLAEPDAPIYMRTVYVHSFGMITEDSFFGRSTGSWSFAAAGIIFLVILITGLIIHTKKEMRCDFYSYKNIRNIGFALLLIAILAEQILLIGNVNDGINGSVKAILNAANLFSNAVFPIAFVTFILVTVSNIQLMRNEGRNWKNMLGCILGIIVCIGTVFPTFLGEFLQQTTLVDVHNEKGIALYIELLTENTILAITTYLECVLIGTIILSTKAARRIPSFDKDYILILGCQIKKDGTLTNLLKNRADRAIEFAKMQKEATGKEIVFIPSGGKGDDEIISEAEAIRNYLVETGIAQDRIIVENKSANTFENLRNSMELIRSDGKTDDPKIAFSTTNYHVFRSGVFAFQQGIKAEGIGAKTKSYFWINAFIREFIAVLVSEWKTHVVIVVAWMIMIMLMVGIVFLSNNL